VLPQTATDRCAEILNSPRDLNERCVAWNLLHDHRIARPRSEEWEQAVAAPLRRSLEAAFRFYSDRIADSPSATYLDGRANAVNLLRASAPDVPTGAEQLVHVLDLTNRTSRSVWQLGKDSGIDGLTNLDLADAKSLSESLAQQLAGRLVSQQLPLMRAFFRARELHVESGEPHPPVWVALWRNWSLTVEFAQAESWGDAVGISKPKEGCWLAVLKYPASRAGRLVRPTQFEAGWFGRHFPSPRVCTLGSGGRLVHGLVSGVVPTGDCLWEYLHRPIPWSEHDWLSSATPVSPTLRPVGTAGRLLSDREFHWNRLKRELGEEQVSSWMKTSSG